MDSRNIFGQVNPNFIDLICFIDFLFKIFHQQNQEKSSFQFKKKCSLKHFKSFYQAQPKPQFNKVGLSQPYFQEDHRLATWPPVRLEQQRPKAASEPSLTIQVQFRFEDNLNGIQPQLKTTSMEDEHNGRRPHWKTTLMEDSLNRKRPQWKTTSIKDDLNQG